MKNYFFLSSYTMWFIEYIQYWWQAYTDMVSALYGDFKASMYV